MEQRVTSYSWSEEQQLSAPLPPPNEPNSAARPRFSFEEVCYVLFRHKWKIIGCAILGFSAAIGLYLTSPPIYSSEARLMVKYITEMEPIGATDADGQIRSPVLRGETVINSEMEILTSMDLAVKVAQAVGPERILAKLGGGGDLVQAALAINSGTITDVPRRGSVIRVIFQHPDPSIVRPVLSNLVDQYFIKHFEVHRALASLDDFAEQRHEIGKHLQATEQDLWNLKRTNGVFAIEESKKAAAEQVFRLQQMLSDAETDLATRSAAFKALEPNTPGTNNAALARIPEEEKDHYAAVLNQLEQARHRKSELLGEFLPSSSILQRLDQQINSLEKEKRQLDKQNPNLALSTLAVKPRDPNGNPEFEGFGEPGRIAVLTAKVNALQESLKKAEREEAKLYEVEAPIVELQRTRDLEDKRYRYLSSTLEQAQIDSGLGSSRVSNISRVELPTPPRRGIGSLYKRLAGCAVGGIAIGLALALLSEFFVDQTVKRPGELAALVPAPVFMSIPRVHIQSAGALLADAASEKETNSMEKPAGLNAVLEPYVEALRDRILNRFETLARKPKLVGVCGCISGSGVTTLASGLASSLSEAGDLKVLLVDMKRSHGAVHPMLGKNRSCTLMEALEGNKRQEALVAPNLYLASATDQGNHPVMSSPRKFTTVVPRLNASDYDYIIFDLPPVDDISITPRLAKHMDLTLLVVEAERANRTKVERASSLLQEFTDNVGLVLNKTRNYLPRQLSQSA